MLSAIIRSNASRLSRRCSLKLYVVRHAIAYDRDPERWPDDSVRPLTPRGRRRFRKAARGIARLVPAVDVVLSSPWVRAWDTAGILEDEAGWPAAVRLDALTEDSPDNVVTALEPYAERDSVAVVGHEPYLSNFIGHLLAPGAGLRIEMRKGAVACLEYTSEGRRLLWLLQPKALRKLA
jgi:phosphohistidine phosphatase